MVSHQRIATALSYRRIALGDSVVRARAILSWDDAGWDRGIPSEDSAGRTRTILLEDSAGRARAVLSDDSAGYFEEFNCTSLFVYGRREDKIVQL